MSSSVADQRTVTNVLAEAVRRVPDKPWIVTENGAVSFRELDALSDRLARGLAEAGLSAGDTLIVMLPDVVELVAVWVACCKRGVVEVPVNTAYRGDILVHLVNDSGARTAIVADRFLDRFDAVSERISGLGRYFVYPADGEGVPQPALLPSVAPFTDLLSDSNVPLDHRPRESDLMAIMYTSGTTGNSKGVMVAHAHAYEYADGCATVVELEEADVYYSAGLPLFHIAGKWGVVYASAIRRATAVVPTQFSTRNFWDDVRTYGATATYLLGAMANFLQRQPPTERDADNPMRKVLMCPLLPDVADFASRFDVRVGTAYGSTEVNAPILMPLGTPVTDNQVVGRERADKFEVMIADENDRPVGPNVLGEILVRPVEPWVTMLGYWNQPEATTRMWRNLWLHSGDAGRRDEHGNLYFVDRIKDTIRRRGENISSMEIEGIVNQHPAVLECALFPVKSEHTEEEVMAAVVIRPGHTLTHEELIRFLEPRMAYFMVPRYVDFVKELPKTPTGKVRKHILRETGITPTTWDREAAGVKVSR